jgi:hypothetical protein
MRIADPPVGWRVVKRNADGGTVFRRDDEPNSQSARSSGPKPAPKPAKSAKTWPTLDAAIAAAARSAGGEHVQTWTYQQGDGADAFHVARFNLADGSKQFRPVHHNDAGFVLADPPGMLPLYALPTLHGVSIVYVTEGEKAADAARSIGLTATTSAHGSRSAAKTDWRPLAENVVVILADADEAGEHYAATVAAILHRLGCTVRIVRLPDLPTGGDIFDYIEARECVESETIRAGIEALAEAAPAWQPPAVESTSTIQAFAPFPVQLLPEPIRSFVVNGAKAIGCDASYIALPLLSALAAAIGNTHRIALKRGWTEPAILWTAIVGESGTMKTPAFKLAMRAIRSAQDKAWKEYEAARVEWEAEHLRYEAELTAWKRQAAPGRGDAGDPPTKPAPPIARRYIVSDTTTEALAPILLGNSRGVLLARDELAGWFGSFDRYAKAGKAGADSAHWLSMHNGEALTIDRKTGIPPTIHVPSASVSIAGGIQPGILTRAMGREHHESGMLARLVFAMPPRTVKRWTEADVDAMTEAGVIAVFDELFALTADVDNAGDERPRLVTLAPDGKAAWIAFYNAHAGEQVELTGDLSAAWSKLEGYAARFALVIHLTRCAAGDATVGVPASVDESSIKAGVALARWFGDEAKRVYAVLAESDDDRESRLLVEWIDRKGGVVTARDLTHGIRRYRGDTEAAERDLSALVEAGRGRWETPAPGPKGGAPVKQFHLVPAVTVTTTPAHGTANRGSGDGDTGDALGDAA